MNKKIFTLLESRLFFYIVSFTYRILLDFSYVTFVNPLYEYAGFHINFSAVNYLLSWIATIMIVIFTPNMIKKVSDYFLVTFTFSVLIPMFCLFGFNYEYSFIPVIVNLSAYLWLYFSLKTRLLKGRITYPYIKNGHKTFLLISLSMVLYLIVWYILSGAVRNFNLNLSQVYEFREKNSELTNFGILAYLNIWVLKVFNLSLIAYALLKKNRSLLIYLLLVQVFFYGVSAHKSVLFYPLIIMSIYFYLSRTRSIATVPLSFAITIIICMSFYIYNDNVILSSLFIRRVFFIPNYLTFTYFDFFSNNSFAYWTNTFGFLGSPVYPDGIPSTIGAYLGSDEMNANNGFISSGYANAGVIGVFLYVLLITFILKLIDQFSMEIGALWFALCIVITPLRSIIISSDLLTVILTHGLLVAVILLFLLRTKIPRLN